MSAALLLPNLFLSASAHAQADVFSLFGSGAEAKSHAGAGQLASRNAAANYYNPANVSEMGKGLEPYVALDYVALDYSYRYPGYEAVAIKRNVPVPFLGVAFKPPQMPQLAVAASFLPIPASSGDQKIEKLPSRQFGDAPIVVNVQQRGGGTGLRASLGAAYKPLAFASFGLSYQASISKTTLDARDAITDTTMARDTFASNAQTFVLGARSTWLGIGNAALTVRPPSITKTRGRRNLPAFDVTLDRSGTTRGPLGVGLGVDAKVWRGLTPFFEVQREQWSALRKQQAPAGLEKADSDYFDTTDTALGADYRHGANNFSLAYGINQSPIGQGQMKDEDGNGKDLVGMEFQSLDGVPVTTYAAGYQRRFPTATLQTSLSMTRGQRDVWEHARGYGHYELSLFSLTLGWTQKL